MPLTVIGLGNPGTQYSQTRHNVGFLVIDRIAEQLNIHVKKPAFKRFKIGKGFDKGKSVFLVKPLTYMNLAGGILKDIFKYTKTEIDDLVIVCDTLDLGPGVCRLKEKGSSAGQKGLESIIYHIRTNEFMRLYIGIGRPKNKEHIAGYVLKKPAKQDRMLIKHAVNRAAQGIIRLLHEPAPRVMNDLNQIQSES